MRRRSTPSGATMRTASSSAGWPVITTSTTCSAKRPERVLRSSDRILTTHVGSLPRTQAVTDVLFARENGGALPPDADGIIAAAVADIVRKQIDVGIDIA